MQLEINFSGVRDTSREAYRYIKDRRDTKRQIDAVYEILKAHPEGISDNMLRLQLGCMGITMPANTVSARRNDLGEKVFEVTRNICPVTHKRVIFWSAK